jgi:hypothetical protein
MPSKNPTPEQECRCTELHSLVHTTVRALPTRLCHVAEDRFYEELSLNALAESGGLGLPLPSRAYFEQGDDSAKLLSRASAIHQGRSRKDFVKTFEGKVIIITGGSAGIGRAAQSSLQLLVRMS